jgi:hypothetical protein
MFDEEPLDGSNQVTVHSVRTVSPILLAIFTTLRDDGEDEAVDSRGDCQMNDRQEKNKRKMMTNILMNDGALHS